ncbi:MAG: hypothetical protein IH859_07880 [Chloroflexi bacterium]|nr:hypothetical protein [Chloroflexota bacterium]
MKCPNCNHISDKALLECSSCGEIYYTEQLETFQHLEHLVKWLNSQREAGFLGVTVHARLKKQAEGELEEVRNILLPPEEIVPARPIKEIAREHALTSATLSLLHDWIEGGLVDMYSGGHLNTYLEYRIDALHNEPPEHLIDIVSVDDLEIVDFALESLDIWLSEGSLESDVKLRAHLIEERKHILEPIPDSQVQPEPSKTGEDVPEFLETIDGEVDKAVKEAFD